MALSHGAGDHGSGECWAIVILLVSVTILAEATTTRPPTIRRPIVCALVGVLWPTPRLRRKRAPYTAKRAVLAFDGQAGGDTARARGTALGVPQATSDTLPIQVMSLAHWVLAGL
jgi:hypothetical protein